jgi:ribosome biogenesis GTPase
MQHIKQWGLPQNLENKINLKELDSSEVARVSAVHKERYVIEKENGKSQAEITGNLRFSAQSPMDFPAVGDWVKIVEMDANNAIILEVFKRANSLKRKASGKVNELQMIASNIDAAFICMSVDQNFNLNRIDRYLAICLEEAINAIVILTKSDLVSEKENESLKSQVSARHSNIQVLALSSQTKQGLNEYYDLFETGKTYCFLGSSGVGKSTLVNELLGSEEMKTSELSESNSKGRHTTSHRELFLLPNGSLVIDSPGMRELGMAQAETGIEAIFDQISELTSECRYNDCTHTSEPGCAVLIGIEEGVISEDAYESYLKLRREEAHYSEKEAEKRQKGKQFSKLVKTYYKMKKDNQ